MSQPSVDRAELADLLPRQNLPGGGDHVVVAAGAKHAVHLGQLGQNFLLIALGQTAGDEDLPHQALGLFLRDGKNVVDGLALGGVDEAAGVDDDQIDVLRLRANLKTRLGHQIHHLLAVHLVLGTAEADKGYSLRHGNLRV